MSSSSSETSSDREDAVRPAADDADDVVTKGEPLLSDEEIQALRDENADAGDGPRPFDFSKPRVLRRNQHEGIDEVFQEAAKAVAICLRREMRAEVTIDYVGGQALPFDQVLADLVEPINLFPVAFRGFDLHGIVTIEAPLAFAFVDALLGGSGAGETAGRSLTVTESAVASRLIEQILTAFHGSLRPAVDLEFDVDGFVDRRTQLDLLKPPVAGYLTEFHAHWEHGGGTFRYVLPLKTLRPLLTGPHGTAAPAAKGGRNLGPAAKMLKAFLEVEMEMTASVSGPPLSFRDLADLEVGDVLPLGRKLEDSVEVRIEGSSSSRGSLGSFEGTCAVVLSKWCGGGR